MTQTPQEETGRTTPSEKSSIDMALEHVEGAARFGFTWMPMGQVIEMLKRAKAGTLGKFAPPF